MPLFTRRRGLDRCRKKAPRDRDILDRKGKLMAFLEIIDRHIVYANPAPQNRSRHGYFPGLVKLPSGDLLAMFMLGEAMEAANVTTVVSRSGDQGRTWSLEGPIHQKDAEHIHDCDSLKPTLLKDGTLIATGYRFHRTDPDQTLTNPETDGVCAGENIVSFSRDEGHTWSHPQVIPATRPELIEESGPSIQLARGTILAVGSLFPMWDGTNPSGALGVLLQKEAGSETWDDKTTFFDDPTGQFAPSEARLCEIQPDRVVALFWMLDHVQGKNVPNHVAVSHDGGRTWSEAMDTGVQGQASNLMHWKDELLLTIHCHRVGKDIGLYVRLVDFAEDRWRTIEESLIWDNAPSRKVAAYATMGQDLKFGQPSLLRLDNGDILATHWAIEDGQGKILTHRLRVKI